MFHGVSIGKSKPNDAVAPPITKGGERILRTDDSGRILRVFVSVAIAASLFAGFASAENYRDTVDAVVLSEIAQWTVLVYLTADNDLDALNETDLEELKRGGSSSDVNVLILLDTLYEPAYLLSVEDHELVKLESLGEVNMGDQKTLEQFVDYSSTNYPSEHMLLFFWNHGSDVDGIAWDQTMEDGSPGDDEWGGDWLSHHEAIAALDGHHVDIMAMDECSIGQMETVYEYRVKGLDTDYMVASESSIGYRGFSYDEILLSLNACPEMSEEELSLIIVDEFTELFSVAPFQWEILTTQSVFKMSEVEALGQAVLVLADTLAEDIDSYSSVISTARRAAITPGSPAVGRIDMPTFVGYIMDSLEKNDPAAVACAEVLSAYEACMIGMGTTKNSERFGYEGMGIRFPPAYAMYTTSSYTANTHVPYMSFEFPNSGWWAFLETYWGVATETVTYEYYLTGNPEDVVTQTSQGMLLAGGSNDIADAMRWMISKSGGGDFVVIRCSGSDGYNPWVFNRLGGVDSVESIVFLSQEACYDSFILNTIRNAEALFIAGGDQWDYVSMWNGTPVEDAIHFVANKPAPVGGTSAGLAILGEFAFSAKYDTIDSEAALINPYNRSVAIERDFLSMEHMEDKITDSHFVARDRMGRLVTFLARIVEDGWSDVAMGIGIDEKTALGVDENGDVTVFSLPGYTTGSVYMLRTPGPPDVCDPNTPLTYTGVSVYRISAGATFNLATWTGEGGTGYTLSAIDGVLYSDQSDGSIY
ncbi:MAG: clostripain-related cysteine peptidase [Thermoplasmata archaeon]|nr:clostripain-related cysteine peptidase [Thermoplasmata archaeon]